MSLEQIVANLVEKVERRFFGKYRGFVVDNADPEHLGRLTLQVPSVLGASVVTGWALPCLPYGGAANQGFLFIPEEKAGVWVEFEEGDLEFPIWTGTFWSKPSGDSELPKPNQADGKEASDVQDPPTRKIIKTKKGHTIQLEDVNGDEMIIIYEGVHKHIITLDTSGITITEGSGKSKLTLTKDKVIVQHGSAPLIAIDSSCVSIGGETGTEPLVLGQQLSTNIQSFLVALATHTHVASSMGGPTTPPMGSFSLNVPLSKHKVEP
ncbi:MAG: phage baseplate assembly protein V [Chloroflexales bacterium]